MKFDVSSVKVRCELCGKWTDLKELHAIIQALATKEPQTTRELRKRIAQTKGLKHTSYSTVNKRVRSLEESGYLRKAAVKERTGGITNYYELRPKAYLATFLNSTSIEDLLNRANDVTALTILGALIGAVDSNTEVFRA